MANNNTICISRRDYSKEDLQGATIVIAATDNIEINNSIADEARRQRILVNVVDDPQHSDFIVPSYFKRADITIAISTSGKSPALARKIRSELEKNFGVEYANLVSLVSEVRSELKQQGVIVHSNTWQEALDVNLLIEMIRSGQEQEAKDILLSKLKSPEQRKL